MRTMVEIPDNVLTIIKSMLKPGEEILWQGQPKSLALTKPKFRYAYILFMVITFVVFYIIKIISVFQFYSFFGYLILAAFLLAIFFSAKDFIKFFLHGKGFDLKSKSENTYYVLTNLRAIVYVATADPEINEYTLFDLDCIQVTSHRDGSGTIEFCPDKIFNSEYRSIKNVQVAFYNIENFENVYGMLKNILIK